MAEPLRDPSYSRRPPRHNRYNVGKTYLLFQEFYGHAGVENRGRNFGPAPWLARALDVPPACPKRRLGSVLASAAPSRCASHAPGRTPPRVVLYPGSGPLRTLSGRGPGTPRHQSQLASTPAQSCGR